VKHWSLTTLREKLIKIGAKVVAHSRHVIFQMAGEQSGLSLIHAVLLDVSKRWRGIKMAPADLEKLNRLRGEVVPVAAAG